MATKQDNKTTVRTHQYAVVCVNRVIFARARHYMELETALKESGFELGNSKAPDHLHVLAINEVWPDDDVSLDNLVAKWN